MRWGILATAAVVGLVLSACAPLTLEPGSGIDSDDVLMTSTVDGKTVPGFVAEQQSDEDMPPGVDVASFGVDPATMRYQGEWAGDDFFPGFTGYDIYLGVSGTSTVHIITVAVDNPDISGSGSSVGNTVIGLGEPVSLQYLPQGTSVVPDGWHALSDWIIVRD